MPELPEVETIVGDLRALLVGQTIVSVKAGKQRLRTPWRKRWESLLKEQRIESLRRRGKWIVVELTGDLHMLVHLGLTGQLTVVPRDTPLKSHTHLVWSLRPSEQELRFRDVRRFGGAAVFESGEDVESFFAQHELGPEPFAITVEEWRANFVSTLRCLKAILLDQKVVAGVGNIYADESLFEAQLHPTRRGKDLDEVETDRLLQAVQTVLKRAIAKRGSTIRDYIGGFGLKGGYQEEFHVYSRTGEPCKRCGTPIEMMRLAGRASHYCPRCQKG